MRVHSLVWKLATLIRLKKHWQCCQKPDHILSLFKYQRLPPINSLESLSLCVCVRVRVRVCVRYIYMYAVNISVCGWWWETDVCWFDSFALQTQPDLADKKCDATHRWHLTLLFLFLTPFPLKPVFFLAFLPPLFYFLSLFSLCLFSPPQTPTQLCVSLHQQHFSRVSF